MRISSSLPRPTRVAGSSASRTCHREPSILAPALSANSWSSSSESRPAAVGSPARPRGAFFKPTPTNKTRSRLSISCAVFIRYDCLDERKSLKDSLSSGTHYTLFDLSAGKPEGASTPHRRRCCQNKRGKKLLKLSTVGLKFRIACGFVHPSQADEPRYFGPFFGGGWSETHMSKNADDVCAAFRLNRCNAGGNPLILPRPSI